MQFGINKHLKIFEDHKSHSSYGLVQLRYLCFLTLNCSLNHVVTSICLTQNLLLNTDSPELETLMGLAKTKLENNICIFQSGFFYSVSLEKYERLD